MLQLQAEALQEKASLYAPMLYLDLNEPFRPIRVGVTVYEQPGLSLSCDREFRFNPEQVQYVIEYAIYWDYDIQHIYDLEHVWVYVGHEGEIVSCESSFHGQYRLGLLPDRSNITEDGHVHLFVQPGKHAMLSIAEAFRLLPNHESCCMEEAGDGGVLEPDMFAGQFKFGAGIDALAEQHLLSFRFKPSFQYAPYEWEPEVFVSWDELRAEIPVRLKELLLNLPTSV